MESGWVGQTVDELKAKNPTKNVLVFHDQFFKAGLKGAAHKHYELKLNIGFLRFRISSAYALTGVWRRDLGFLSKESKSLICHEVSKTHIYSAFSITLYTHAPPSTAVSMLP